MDAHAALSHAIDECLERFEYVYEPPGMGDWQAPSKTETKGRGDCEDLAVWCIKRAWGLCPGIEILLVWGVTLEGNGHVWIELVDGDKVYWADTEQKRSPEEAFSYSDTRTPWMAARFDGDEFGPLFIYLPRKRKDRFVREPIGRETVRKQSM